MPEKRSDILVPKAVRARMIAPAIKAMMMPYSTAVAPDSSTQKFLIFSILVVPPIGWCAGYGKYQLMNYTS